MRSFFKIIKSSIVAGIITIVPVATSIFIITKLFFWIDNLLPSIIGVALPRGTGIVGILLVTLITGLVARNYIGKYIIRLVLAFIASIPILSKIYITLQQMMDLVINPSKNLLGKVVLVEYPRRGTYCIGFVTTYETEEISESTGRKMVCVYVPTTPNPTSGMMIYIAESELIDVNLKPEVAAKAIVSAGMVSSSKTNTRKSNYTFPEVFARWRKHMRDGILKNNSDPRD